MLKNCTYLQENYECIAIWVFSLGELRKVIYFVFEHACVWRECVCLFACVQECIANPIDSFGSWDKLFLFASCIYSEHFDKGERYTYFVEGCWQGLHCNPMLFCQTAPLQREAAPALRIAKEQRTIGTSC